MLKFQWSWERNCGHELTDIIDIEHSDIDTPVIYTQVYYYKYVPKKIIERAKYVTLAFNV